jgi:hypothetical protein
MYRALIKAPGMEGMRISPHLPDARSSALAVVSRTLEGSNRIACAQYIGSGVIGGYKPERQYTLARILGVSNSRILVKWKEVEEKEGVFNYSKLDKEVAENIAWGLKPWMGLDDIHLPGEPSLAGASVPTWVRLKENTSPQGVDQEVLAKWAQYVHKTVDHYKDRISHFECLNEPSIYNYPKVYMDFLKTMHREVRKIDPDLKVMGPSSFLDWEFGQKEKGFLLPLMQDGLSEYIDIFTFHHYEIPDADEPGPDSSLTATERYRYLKRLIPQIEERKMPLWSNEYALHSAEWYIPTDGRVPPTDIFRRLSFGWETDFNEAVNYAVKDVVIGYYHGVRLFSPHILFGGGSEDQKSVWPQHGIGYGWYLKPDVVAFAVTCSRFGPDVEPASWFLGSETASVYIFKTKRGVTAVLFTVPRAGLEYTWHSIPDGLVVENVFGADYPWIKKSSSLIMAIGAEPVFLILEGGTPEKMEKWLKNAHIKVIAVKNNREFLGSLTPLTEHFPTWSIQ